MKVSTWHLWIPLTSLVEAQARNGLAFWDANDEAQMKHVFQTEVLPLVESMHPSAQAAVQHSLAFYLESDPKKLKRLLASHQDLLMTEPSDVRQIFIWLWQVLYPGTSPNEIDLTNCVEDNDFERTNDLCL